MTSARPAIYDFWAASELDGLPKQTASEELPERINRDEQDYRN
jgi:hypothetical protein